MKNEKAIVLTGMRRVGKTTLARCLFEKERGKKLFLDLENPLNQSYFQALDFDFIHQRLNQLAQGQGKLTVFLDETQNLPPIPQIVKYLLDHYQVKFFLTGSVAFYLKNLFSESLAGRKQIFELFPLNFKEFLEFKSPNLTALNYQTPMDEPFFETLIKYREEYLQWGGFPAVILNKDPQDKKAELSDITTSYFQKEVKALSDFRKIDVFQNLITLLTARLGSKLDVAKIASELGVSRPTILEYLDFLEQSYFIKRISPYSSKLDVTVRGQKKAYFCDNGILNYLNPALTKGQIFENAVFRELQNKGQLFFYQTKSRLEIDFIQALENGEKRAFEAKETANTHDLKRLNKLADRLKINQRFIVAKNFYPHPQVRYLNQL